MLQLLLMDWNKNILVKFRSIAVAYSSRQLVEYQACRGHQKLNKSFVIYV